MAGRARLRAREWPAPAQFCGVSLTCMASGLASARLSSPFRRSPMPRWQRRGGRVSLSAFLKRRW
eukprot:7349138-Alexandrium_andersonii.AAC.1